MKLLALLTITILVSSCGKQTKTVDRIIEVEKPASPKFVCKIYDLHGITTGVLPNFSTLESIGSVEVESLNNPVTNNVTPFPILNNTDFFNITEEIGLVCEGKLKLSKAGSYSFYLNSDDGSKLYLNNYLLIDNNGTHGSVKKSASVVLIDKEVTVKVEYFNGFGDKSLTLSMKQPTITFEELVRF